MGLTPRGRTALAVALALLAVATVGTGRDARAAQFGRNKVQYRAREWKVVRTEHFDVYFYEGSGDIAE